MTRGAAGESSGARLARPLPAVNNGRGSGRWGGLCPDHGRRSSELPIGFAFPGGGFSHAAQRSVITKASAERLGLAEGKEVCAVIKASNVMIASE